MKALKVATGHTINISISRRKAGTSERKFKQNLPLRFKLDI